MCAIGETEEKALASIPAAGRARFGERLKSALIGTPDTIRTRLAEYEAAGVQELLLMFPDVTTLNSLRLFAKEFICVMNLASQIAS